MRVQISGAWYRSMLFLGGTAFKQEAREMADRTFHPTLPASMRDGPRTWRLATRGSGRVNGFERGLLAPERFAMAGS